MYDLFFAPSVPSYCGGESITSEIFVQIRSKLLWEIGCKMSYDFCMKTVKAFCNFFGFTIVEIHEARTDFCWHTNGLQDPEHYLKIDNLTSMRVSQFKDVQQHYRYTGDDEYESDYVAHGRRGGKCFLRIYLKTKEVVEMGYKPWFFYVWFFNQMISRYDLYVLEKALLAKNWKFCDIPRLEFAKEYLNPSKDVLAQIEKLLNFDIKNKLKQPDYDAIRKLADLLTPRITKIMNIEYQVTRKMSKSFKLFSFKDNQGLDKRIYDFLDNRKLITDYLTHDTFRLVDRNSNPRKTRCDYTDFWKRLRNTKQVDVPVPPECLKLMREYNSKISVEIRKTRAVKSIVSFGAVTNGNEQINIFDDAYDLLSYLNDNDVVKASHYKSKAVALLPKTFQIEDDDDLVCDEDGVIPD
ncbi:MAG: hypothetical protein K6C97_12575 [Treponema sp.]|nr:hypothetical protein [Treponema sp.]